MRKGFVGFLQWLGGVDRFTAVPSQCFANEIPRDAAQPGAQLRRFAKFRQALPCGHECFLCQVLALGQAGGGAVGQRTNQRLVVGHDPPKRIAVAGQGLRYKSGIVVICLGHCQCCHHITV